MAQVSEIFLPDELYYDRKEHIWAKVEDGAVRVGLDMFGQKAAGTVAYVKLLPAGRLVPRSRAFGSLEAGKYIGPLKAPVSGEIVGLNPLVQATPTLVNTDPYGDGWFVVLRPTELEKDLAELVHGVTEIQAWAEDEYRDYTEKGLFGEA